jgi:hypothetical protein
MFKNRALEVRMVKSTPNGDTPNTNVVSTLTPDQINEILQAQVKNVAIAVGVVVAGAKLLNTVSEIAVIAANARIR